MKKVQQVVDAAFLVLNLLVVFLFPSQGKALEIYNEYYKVNLIFYPFLLFVFCHFFTSFFQFREAWQSHYFKGFLLLFCFYLLSALFFGNANSWKLIEGKLSFLTIPLVVFTNRKFYLQHKVKLLISLFFGVLITLFLLDLRTIVIYDMTNNLSFYTVYTFKLHPSYIGASLIILLVFSLELFLFKDQKKIVQAFMLFCILLLFAHLLIIGSKAVIILAGLIFCFYVFRRKANRSKRTILISVFVIPFLVLMINSQFRNTAITLFKSRFSDLTEIKGHDGSTSYRFQMVRHFHEIIKDKWIFGVGVGNEDDYLQSYFTKNNWQIPLVNHYNSHNQFLQTCLSIGVVGMLVLVALILLPLFFNFEIHFKVLLLGFVFLFFTEAMLERQHGIVMFTLLYCVLMASSPGFKSYKFK